ncbi:MAG: class I SAM-dependent methyltransferase [Actinomycetia bacterium]|nr:class I SAM-dependent methyltransferase [Actinomycetes bacterium]
MSDGSSLDAAVLAYYQQGHERGRLETWCQLEFIRTQELLHRFLPPPPARVLDVGGAAGIHAKPLADAGYDMTLTDPVSLHIDQARAAGIPQAELGDARQLRFDDDTFDAVLLLGPLYHLPNRCDRIRAIKEARRVAGPSGLVLAAIISRFASTQDGLSRKFLLDQDFEEIVKDDIATGHHQNPDDVPGWFTTAYFHDPLELDEEFHDGGCSVNRVLAIEGPASNLPDTDEWLNNPVHRDVLLRAIRRVEDHPSLLGASSHLLVVSQSATG